MRVRVRLPIPAWLREMRSWLAIDERPKTQPRDVVIKRIQDDARKRMEQRSWKSTSN